jgi:hypothetical protein
MKELSLICMSIWLQELAEATMGRRNLTAKVTAGFEREAGNKAFVGTARLPALGCG